MATSRLRSANAQDRGARARPCPATPARRPAARADRLGALALLAAAGALQAAAEPTPTAPPARGTSAAAPLELIGAHVERLNPKDPWLYRLVVRNGGAGPLGIRHLLVAQGDHVSRAVARDDAQVLWWRAFPPTIPPGGYGDVRVKLMRPGDALARCDLVGDGCDLATELPAAEDALRIVAVRIDRADHACCVYWRADQEESAAPLAYLDGRLAQALPAARPHRGQIECLAVPMADLPTVGQALSVSLRAGDGAAPTRLDALKARLIIGERFLWNDIAEQAATELLTDAAARDHDRAWALSAWRAPSSPSCSTASRKAWLAATTTRPPALPGSVYAAENAHVRRDVQQALAKTALLRGRCGARTAASLAPAPAPAPAPGRPGGSPAAPGPASRPPSRREDHGRGVGADRRAHGGGDRGAQRLRGLLALAVSYAACGGAGWGAVPAAVAVECVHAASLAVDDLPCLDDAPPAAALARRSTAAAGRPRRCWPPTPWSPRAWVARWRAWMTARRRGALSARWRTPSAAAVWRGASSPSAAAARERATCARSSSPRNWRGCSPGARAGGGRLAGQRPHCGGGARARRPGLGNGLPGSRRCLRRRWLAAAPRLGWPARPRAGARDRPAPRRGRDRGSGSAAGLARARPPVQKHTSGSAVTAMAMPPHPRRLAPGASA